MKSVSVGDELDLQLLGRVELGGVGERLVADLVAGIAGVGDEHSEEDLLVRVEGVDDEGHQLGDLGLEGEGLGLGLGHLGVCVVGCDGWKKGESTVCKERERNKVRNVFIRHQIEIEVRESCEGLNLNPTRLSRIKELPQKSQN